MTDRNPLSRRTFIRNAALVGAGALAGALTVTTVQQVRSPEVPSASPVVYPGSDRAVRLEDLAGDAVQVATAEWRAKPAVVYKVRWAALRMAAELRGRDTTRFAVQHPHEPEHALVAYDGRCKHLGCTVGWAPQLGANEEVSDWDGDGEPDGRVLCPCHQAQYDVHDLGRQLPGTPAPEPLDVLRIELSGEEVWALERRSQRVVGDAL